MNDKKDHIIVVGAGVMGLSIAWRLLREGVNVTVIEKSKVGGEASFAAAGMLAASAEVGYEEFDLYTLCRTSLQLWPTFAKELEADSGITVDYRSHGTLIVADDPDAAVALKRGYDFQKAHDYPVEWLTRDETLEVEPFLNPRIVASVRASEDHAVDNRMVLKGLQLAIVKLGGQIVEHTEIESIDIASSHPSVVSTNGKQWNGSKIVIAAGAWSRSIQGLPSGISLPVRPVKGQILELKMERPFELQHVIRSRKGYMVPRTDGRLIVGASSEEMGFDKRMTAGGVHAVLEGARDMVPGILDLELLDVTVGLRPGSRDHQPIVGYCASDRLFVATGHYRHGIILSAITAVEAAKSLVTGHDSQHFDVFSPNRFLEPKS